MALLPVIESDYTERDVTDTFLGYRHQPKIADGEFYDTQNLTSSFYPLLANRKKRSLAKTMTAAQGILAKEKLAYVDDGKLFYDGAETSLSGLTGGKKQLVSMGAYICVFPDKRYYNTADPTDYGSMEAVYTSTGAVTYKPCKLDGTEYANPTKSDTAPENPDNGALWIDTSQSTHSLKQFSSSTNEWNTISTVYTKMSFVSQGELPSLLKKYDGVDISGAKAEVCNGEKVIYEVGGNAAADGVDAVNDYIIVIGLLEEAATQSEGVVKISRTVPDMDYVIECSNRLWGCKYGNGLNEIYCCALGDFENWRQYMGLSTDSWTASVGSDGKWTGAINYLGYPMFFKEDRIHRVSVSGQGAHSITETVCRGVEDGSAESLAIVNETLLYKSSQDICAYAGGFPSSISEALGDVKYSDAAAGAIGDKYYISMQSNGEYSLFVYDLKRRLWMKEDGLKCTEFARVGDELYCISGNRLWALMGSDGEEEPFVSWMAESGMLYYQYPDRKYVSRFNLRLYMQEGASLDTYIEYDSDGKWLHLSNIRFRGTNTLTLPIRPRRCDHLRIRLCGKGDVRLYSIARILSIGSDVG